MLPISPPLPVRFLHVTERTLSDRLVRPVERTKREGREVAGVRRPGVLHCHSVIIETVLGLMWVICETQLQSQPQRNLCSTV